MSTLRPFQKNPTNVINSAIQLYKSTKTKTIVVEGESDHKFLKQWMLKDSSIRIVDVDGKSNVETIYEKWNRQYKEKNPCFYLLADLDYDYVVNQRLKFNDDVFIYNAFCKQNNNPLFNDLEVFLVNTIAFEKLLVNYLIDKNQANVIRGNLEKVTRKVGAIRAANELLSKNKQISILDGIKIKDFFIGNNFTFDSNSFVARLRLCSPRKLEVDDLIQLAGQLESDSNKIWYYSRGHDLTEFMALYLSDHTDRTIYSHQVELNLRLGANLSSYLGSPMGKQLQELLAQDQICFFESIENY